ncbi:MAG: phytanoyl-CoA dioxygenase family protein [Capsulimonadales bacterium]|nr:phytanoyl-CoA dioxygenase family protein [Capsulimonadales bacterium]
MIDGKEVNREAIYETFFRNGCVCVPGVFSAGEVTELRERTDRHAADPATAAKHLSYVGDTFVLRRCHELDPVFAAATEKETVLGLLAPILTTGIRFNAMNILRNGPGQAISTWHVDDLVEFPLPPEIPRFDPRIRMPVLWLTVQVALSDIDTLDHGPTEFVPGSHYSGRRPPPEDPPTFEGREPEAMLCRAGDVYLFNHQTWHRGRPNRSDRTRYLMQLQYAQRWADARFKGLA